VPVDAVTALSAAARFGPYFVWEPYDGAPGWRPFADLLDPEVAAERVGIARDTLVRMSGLGRDDIAERVVASITFLGLASRLLSPLLGAVTAGGANPVPEPGKLWWRPVAGGPVPFACRDLGVTQGDALTVDLVEPLLEAFRRRFALSGQVLRGNVASALGGAAGMIADADPGLASRAAAVVAAALEQEPLRGAATLERPDPRRDRWFLVRRNCCLYYRIPGGGTCGDCVLTPDDVRRRQWRAVLARADRP
jgi:hypothetical protein